MWNYLKIQLFCAEFILKKFSHTSVSIKFLTKYLTICTFCNLSSLPILSLRDFTILDTKSVNWFWIYSKWKTPHIKILKCTDKYRHSYLILFFTVKVLFSSHLLWKKFQISHFVGSSRVSLVIDGGEGVMVDLRKWMRGGFATLW